MRNYWPARTPDGLLVLGVTQALSWKGRDLKDKLFFPTMVQMVGQGRPYFFPYFFWSPCFCWYIHKHQTLVWPRPHFLLPLGTEWLQTGSPGGCTKHGYQTAAGGTVACQECIRVQLPFLFSAKNDFCQHRHGWLLCKTPHNGPATGGQPSYRGSEKHSRMLCSMLTHSKRELNSLYNKIAEHSWTDRLILCRRCAVSTQGNRSEPVVSPLHCPALIIHTEIRNLKLDLEMWLTCWLVMVLRPTVSTVPERLLKDITEPKDTASYFSKVSVGIFKERS